MRSALSLILLSTVFLAACERGSHSNLDDKTPKPTSQPPPHIIVILADDLGYGSLNSYGAYSEVVQTPNIGRLAAEGIRFTDAYSPSSVCSPTRYGVLMGRYPWRTKKKAGVVQPHDPLWPNTERMNLPKWLKTRGYTTATIGKWHLGYGTKRHQHEIEEWINTTMPGPNALGFDYSFDVPQNHGDRFGVYFENGKVVGYDNQGQLIGLRSTDKKDYGNTPNGNTFIGFDAPQRVDDRVTEQITTRAIQWMAEQVAEAKQPFFLYFAPVAVHNPIMPSIKTSGTSGIGPYGDFIHDLDNSIGRVMNSLDEMGIADNTIVIFTSDNGGAIPGNRRSPQRQAILKGLDINGPLRGGKHSIWEGGTRVPLIVRIPDATQALGARVSDTLVNLTDIFATLADLVDNGTKLPDGVAPDSVSFLPVILNQDTLGKTLRTNTVTASHQGILAIRSGDWKWIEGALPVGFDKLRGIPAPPADEARPQLYNLRDTPEESKDVSSQYPQVVARLRHELDTIRESN